MKLINKPRTIKTIKDPHKGKMILMIVYLRGNDYRIGEVIEQRRGNPLCFQEPRSSVSLPDEYRIRVRYGICSEGVFVHRIDIQLGSKWSCFFCNDGRDGVRGSHRIFRYFLHQKDHEVFIAPIARFEEKRELKRLAKIGPSVFPRRRSG